MRRLLIGAYVLMALAGVVAAWPVTDTEIGLNFPDALATDTPVLRVPFSVFGWCWNESKAVDYYEVWLIHDEDGDGVVSDTDLAGRVVVRYQEDFNLPERYNQRLTPRHAVNTDNTTPGEKYFMFIYALDIDGGVSTDTDIVGADPRGGGMMEDEAIAYFEVRGLDP